MDCSTCGAVVPNGRTRCSECGTRVVHPAPVLRPLSISQANSFGGDIANETGAVATCPRCGYRGEGLRYFARGLHIAALVGLFVLTAGFLGVGALIFFLMRRAHRVCPRCGLDWGGREHGLLAAGARAGSQFAFPTGLTGAANRHGAGAWLLWVLAAILMVIGVAELELVPVLLAGLAGGGGWMLQRSAREAREARRAALLGSLQPPVLRLAEERGGTLTVTEVAAQMGWTLTRAEKVLESLNDGFRVTSEITGHGTILYEFRELRMLREQRWAATDEAPEDRLR